MIDVLRYQAEDATEPVTEWLNQLRDRQTQARLRIRLRRLEAGNFGDCHPVGEGVPSFGSTWAPDTVFTLAATGRRSSSCCVAAIKNLRNGTSGRPNDFGRLETEAAMSKKLVAAVLHHEREIAELRADRELAVAYLKAAMESIDDPDDRAGALLALRTVAEAYGGLGAVAAQAGISRESLYRALSAKGNPTLKTILAVLKAVGMRLSVETEEHALA